MPASQSGVREFLWIVKESALGVKKTSPVAGVDSMYIRLPDSNSFGMLAAPIVQRIPYGGGIAIDAEAITDHYEAKGSLKTPLYPSQALMMMGWMATRINAAQTLPWPTTEPPGDLASCTIYHAVRFSDGTFQRKKVQGVKVAGGTIDVSRGSTTAMLSLDLVGGQVQGNKFDNTPDPDATEFPPPVETDYPTGPYTFHMTAGGLTVGSVRTQYEDLSIKFQNALDSRWFEGSYVSVNAFCGRATSLDAGLYLKSSPDDRGDLEALVAKTASVLFANGVTGQNMLITFNGNNRITSLPYDLPLNTVFMNKLTLGNLWDPTALSGAGNDLAISFS